MPAHLPPSSAAPRLDAALVRAARGGAYAFALFVPWSVAGVHISLGIALGAMILLRVRGVRVWTRSALDLPVLLVTAAAILSIPLATFAGSPPAGWHSATLWRSFLAPPVVLSALALPLPGEARDAVRGRALRALAIWAAAALVPSLLAWVQIRNGFDLLYALHLRRTPHRAPMPRAGSGFAAVGFFWWYSVFAQNLSPPLLLAGAVALYGRVARRLRVLLGVATVAAALAVALTFSRAAWAALAASAFLVVVLGGLAHARRALPLVLGAFVVIALAQPVLRTRLVNALAQGENENRKQIWMVCESMRQDYPWTGMGWGNVHARNGAYYDRLVPWAGVRAGCHDIFYTALVDGGPLLLAGTVAYFALLFAGFYRLARRGTDPLARAAARGGLAATLVLLLNGLWHDVFYSSEPMYGAALALAAAAALAFPSAAASAAPAPADRARETDRAAR